MKQVSRKFLEEQVKKALNETGVAASGGHPHYGSSEEFKKQHEEWTRNIANFTNHCFPIIIIIFFYTIKFSFKRYISKRTIIKIQKIN